MKFFRIFTIAFLAVVMFAGCGFFGSSEKSVPEEEQLIKLIYKIDSPDGKFSISFPGKPDFSSEPFESEYGTIQNSMYIYEHSSSLAYMLAYTDYPDRQILSFDPYELLENAMYGFVDEIGISVETSEKISFGDYPGIEFIASGSGYRAHMRDFLQDERLYQVGMLSSIGSLNDADVRAFFQSFQLRSSE